MFVGLLLMSLVKSFTYLVQSSTNASMIRCTCWVWVGLVNCIPGVFVFIMSLILGLSFSSYNEIDIIFSDLEYILAYFLKLTAFFSFCLFLGILVKRSAFAIGFLFVWNIIEGIIIGLMKWRIFKNSDTADTIAQFLPLESMSNLIKEAFTR